MKIIFMGSPEFAIPALEALHQEYEICMVYTQPPRPSNRGHKLNKTAIHQRAEALSLAVRHPLSLKSSQEQEEFAKLGADIAVVAAYGLLLPQAILDGTKRGCLNIHPSLLPRWRGAAPLQRQIEAGDEMTAVCIMQMDKGLDTGDILSMRKFPMENMSFGQLHDFLSLQGAELLLDTLSRLDEMKPQKQDDALSCYAKKIEKNELIINWMEDAEIILQKIRAFSPKPAMGFMHNGEIFKIHAAELVVSHQNAGEIIEDDGLIIGCGNKAIRVLRIQRQGKNILDIKDFLRGYSFVG